MSQVVIDLSIEALVYISKVASERNVSLDKAINTCILAQRGYDSMEPEAHLDQFVKSLLNMAPEKLSAIELRPRPKVVGDLYREILANPAAFTNDFPHSGGPNELPGPRRPL